MTDPNQPFRFHLPVHQITPVLTAIEDVGIAALTEMSIEDLETEEVVLASLIRHTRNLCWDLTESPRRTRTAA